MTFGNQMRQIAKTMMLPAGLALVAAALFLWRMLELGPQGKEGWLEQGLYLMAFHLFCLVAVLPVTVWSITRLWGRTSRNERGIMIAAGLGLLAATVAFPVATLRIIQGNSPNHAAHVTSPTGTEHGR
jgi:hypothetical protein